MAGEKKRNWVDTADLHCDPDDAVRGVPEADVPRVRALLWRPPGHHHDEHLHEDEEDEDDVPRSELCAGVPHALVPVADDVEACSQREVEEGGGVAR